MDIFNLAEKAEAKIGKLTEISCDMDIVNHDYAIAKEVFNEMDNVDISIDEGVLKIYWDCNLISCYEIGMGKETINKCLNLTNSFNKLKKYLNDKVTIETDHNSRFAVTYNINCRGKILSPADIYILKRNNKLDDLNHLAA